MQLRELKQLFQQTPQVSIYGAPVKFTIEDLYIGLEWRGLDTGNLFSGSINREGLRDMKVVDSNSIAVRLAFLREGKVVFNKNFTPIAFNHLVGVPILH